MIASSDAIARDAPPPVRLTRIADRLRVVLLFLEEEQADRYEPSPDGLNAVQQNWVRGAIVPNGNRSWLLQAGSRKSTFARQTVAHEFGHALLFHDGSGIDLHAWSATEWSELEEATANYIARLLLAPDELMPRPDPEGANYAAHVVSRIATPFRIPHRVAATRCLDNAEFANSRVSAFVMWRQYHPLSDQLIHTCFRHDALLCATVREAAAQARALLPHCAFERAMALWCEATGGGQERRDAWDRLRFDASELQAITLLRESLKPLDGEGIMSKACFLTQPASHHYFRPDWVVWRDRPARSFVPIQRGRAREGSLAATLGAQQGSALQVLPERVRIGDLSGHFRVHGFAHGDAREGSRYVLTALEQMP